MDISWDFSRTSSVCTPCWGQVRVHNVLLILTLRVIFSDKLPLQLPKRKKKWSVMSQSRSYQSPNEVSNQISYNKIFAVYIRKDKMFSRSSRALAEHPALLPNSWPFCWRRKYIFLKASMRRLTEVRDLIHADQNYLEASLISIPSAYWRAFKKTDFLKMKAHSKTAIQNAHGGILP